jgi:hypothetical protein
MPTQPASPQARWMGVIIGVAFRTFAYGLLLTVTSISLRGLPTVAEKILILLGPIALLSSPLWVPFTAGFLSAYSWGHLQAKEYVRAIWLTALLSVPAVFALSLLLDNRIGIALCFLICLDVGISGKGVDQGSHFWKGQLGRQVLGYFSAHDDTDPISQWIGHRKVLISQETKHPSLKSIYSVILNTVNIANVLFSTSESTNQLR